MKKSSSISFEEWLELLETEIKKKPSKANSTSPEQERIHLKPLYTAKDTDLIDWKNSYPGFEPYVRGSKASMYVGKPWTIRQYSGFSTAEESNAFYKIILKEGGQGISVAFDLPTHRGYDSDNPRVQGDVGKAGVAIDSVVDMKLLFHEIPMDKVSISMTMSGAVLPILACYIVAAEEQGVELKNLSGTIQNDILKEFLVRNTYIYPPRPSIKIVTDIISYCSKHMPKFNSISVSGYHMQEAGADPILELAYTLANGKQYIDACISAGLKIDDFASRISFFFGIGMNFYQEIAKLRAARLLWSRIVSQYNPKIESSKILRTHCQTSGWSLTKQDPYNNIIRTTIEAMAAVFGGTQSLHTNSFDEAIALPTDVSARIARNTQLILQNETQLTSVIDPWGGSYMMESLTQQIVEQSWKIIENINKSGEMIDCVENGSAKLEIEKAAALKQARIEQNVDIIVGLNQFQLTDEKENFHTFEVNTNEVIQKQLERLKKIKAERSEKNVTQALDLLTEYAKNGIGNGLELAINAIRHRATIGEVTLALEKVWGRYIAPHQMIQGCFSNLYSGHKVWNLVQENIKKFSKLYGRSPKILIAKQGQDGHDRGYKVVATCLADLGFEVECTPLFSTPLEVAEHALHSNVHFIACSTLVGSHKILIPQLIEELQLKGAKDIFVFAGGVIPEQDFTFLFDAGVSDIFASGSNILNSALKMLQTYFEKEVKFNKFKKSV